MLTCDSFPRCRWGGTEGVLFLEFLSASMSCQKWSQNLQSWSLELSECTFAPNLFSYELLITLNFWILNMAWMVQALPGVRWWQALSYSFQTFDLFESNPGSVTRQFGSWRMDKTRGFFPPAVELRYCALCTVTLDLIAVNVQDTFTSEISQRRSVWFECKAYAISWMFSTGLHVYVPMTSNSLQRLAQCHVYASCSVLMQTRF